MRSPEATSAFSAFTGIVGDGVGYVAESTFSTLPEEARDSLVNIYGVYKREFPTDNQSYAVNCVAGAAFGGGIKIPGKVKPPYMHEAGNKLPKTPLVNKNVVT